VVLVVQCVLSSLSKMHIDPEAVAQSVDGWLKGF